MKRLIAPTAAILATALAAMFAAGLTGQQAMAQEASARFGAKDAPEIRLRSTTDLDVLGPAIAAFVAQHPDWAVQFDQWGSNLLYDQTLLECIAESGPKADAVISSAVHQMVDLVNRGCAGTYRSDRTAALSPSLQWRDEVWGITREAAVMIYNRAGVPEADVPHTRFALLDLLRPEASPYRGRVSTYDIEQSGLGYLFAYADSLEASTFGALMESFARTGAVATCCSSEIIESVASGDMLIAYNILGSYAQSHADPRVGIVWPEDYTLVLSRGFLLPKGSAQAEGGALLLDFLLSGQGQRVMAQSGLVATLDDTEGSNTEALVPAGALRPIRIEPTLLVARDAEKRARFLARWREVFAR
ncbi:hypothetical protein AQS8620_02173 [Aquimixticola soesokkakensis]|uniref:Bacterial extracellular solute-binding protein n=1 Tax=Aquimixticola soesokkakensis TaxID=1519096 RepID=A0A1Y5SXX4_9RHOB|nr:ABC transporter substrate-binding protein [Aquimixticola soesokkakensis]SLN50443.1 hypothetical protein AQS8620_02173 [Aquimixticola soesokkakensis]